MQRTEDEEYSYYTDEYDYVFNETDEEDENNYVGHKDELIHRIPQMLSTNSDELINEGDVIKLPCIVDNGGMFDHRNT